MIVAALILLAQATETKIRGEGKELTVTVGPNGGMRVEKSDGGFTQKFESKFTIDKNGNYDLKSMVFEAPDGSYVTGDGKPATKEQHEAFEKKRTRFPSGSATVTVWEDKKRGGLMGFDDKRNPFFKEKVVDVGGLAFTESSKIAALGYEINGKLETGAFVIEDENGNQVVVLAGARGQLGGKLIAFEGEKEVKTTVSGVDLSAKVATFTGVEGQVSALVGITPDGRIVQLEASTFAGMKFSSEVSASTTLFGIKVNGRGSGYVSYGAGAEAKGKFAVNWFGQIKFGGALGATLGLGTGTEGSIEIDASPLLMGVDMGEVATRDNWAKIVDNATTQIKAGKLRLRPGMTLDKFARALHERIGSINPDSPAQVGAFFKEFLEVPPLVVRLEPAHTVVMTGEGIDFTAVVESGMPPFTFTWCSPGKKGAQVARKVNEGIRARENSERKAGFETPGTRFVCVLVQDSMTPNPRMARALAMVEVVGELSVELGATTYDPKKGQPFIVEALIYGGRPPYELKWSTSNGDSVTRMTERDFDQIADTFRDDGTIEYRVTVTDSTPGKPQTASDDVRFGEFAVALRPQKTAYEPGETGTATIRIKGGRPPFTVSGHATGTTNEREVTFDFQCPKEPGEYTLEVVVDDALKWGTKTKALLTVANPAKPPRIDPSVGEHDIEAVIAASGNYADENVQGGAWKCQALAIRLFYDERMPTGGRIDFELIGYTELDWPADRREEAERYGMSKPRLYFSLKTFGGNFDPKSGRVWGNLYATVGMGESFGGETEVPGASFEGAYSNGTITGTCQFTFQGKQTFEFRGSFRATKQ